MKFKLTVLWLKRRFGKQMRNVFRVFTNEHERKECFPYARQEVILRSGDIPPLILYLFIRRKWVVGFTPPEKARSTHWVVSWVEPRTISEAPNNRKISRPSGNQTAISHSSSPYPCSYTDYVTPIPASIERLDIYWLLLSHESRRTYLSTAGATTRKTECNITLRKGLLSHVFLFNTVHFQYDVKQKNIEFEAISSCKIKIKRINSWM
jgi:hypothetical protein